jgi:arginase
MCLALAVGRGNTRLARLHGAEPLVRTEDVALIGRRDHADSPWYGQEVLATLPMLDISHATVCARGANAVAQDVLKRVTRFGLNGFWIHLDADVLDPSVMPAVDSPVSHGLDVDDVAALLRPLVKHPSALGIELTIYDPSLDPDHSSAARLSNLLVDALGEHT